MTSFSFFLFFVVVHFKLGYTCQIVFVPELKLAVIVQRSDGVNSNSQDVAFDSVFAFAPALSSLYTKLAPPSPDPPQSIIGHYHGRDEGFSAPRLLGSVNRRKQKTLF